MRLAPTQKTALLTLAVFAILIVPLLLRLANLPALPCLIRLLTGIPCPGCGLTRSLMALYQGDLVTSFRYHPLGLPLFLLCILLLPRLLLRRTFLWTETQKRNLLTFAGTLLISVYLLRLTLHTFGNHFFLW